MAHQDKVKVTQQTSFPHSPSGDSAPVAAAPPPVTPSVPAAAPAVPSRGAERPPRRILVINDDGIESPGLWAAVRALRRLAPVFVVAPSRQQSGVGASLTLHDAIGVRPWPLPPEFAAPSDSGASPADAAISPTPGGSVSADTASSAPTSGGNAPPASVTPYSPPPGVGASADTARSAPTSGGSASPDTAAPTPPGVGAGDASAAAARHPVVAYVVEGTPGDCCILALESLVGRVGLVVSGVNSGSNVGWDVMVSGTVGGAVQAFIRGCSTIAISVGSVNAPRYDAAGPLLERLGGELLERAAPPLFLNVNLPNLPPDRLAGVRLTRGGGLSYRESVRLEGGGEADGAERRYRIARNLPGNRPPPAGSDIQALRDNCVSITPLRLGLGDDTLAPALESELRIFNFQWSIIN